MCNLSDLVEARGEVRGEARGRKMERFEVQKELVLEMLQDNMPYEKIIQHAKVSLEQIKQWEQELSSEIN